MGLWTNPARNSWFFLALVAIGVDFFFAAVILRTDVVRRLRRSAAAPRFELIQRYWVVFSLVAAVVVMAVATLWPVGFGALLGAPAVVFIGLGLIIPVMATAIQIGASLGIPVVGAMLLWRL